MTPARLSFLNPRVLIGLLIQALSLFGQTRGDTFKRVWDGRVSLAESEIPEKVNWRC